MKKKKKKRKKKSLKNVSAVLTESSSTTAKHELNSNSKYFDPEQKGAIYKGSKRALTGHNYSSRPPSPK